MPEATEATEAGKDEETTGEEPEKTTSDSIGESLAAGVDAMPHIVVCVVIIVVVVCVMNFLNSGTFSSMADGVGGALAALDHLIAGLPGMLHTLVYGLLPRLLIGYVLLACSKYAIKAISSRMEKKAEFAHQKQLKQMDIESAEHIKMLEQSGGDPEVIKEYTQQRAQQRAQTETAFKDGQADALVRRARYDEALYQKSGLRSIAGVRRFVGRGGSKAESNGAYMRAYGRVATGGMQLNMGVASGVDAETAWEDVRLRSAATVNNTYAKDPGTIAMNLEDSGKEKMLQIVNKHPYFQEGNGDLFRQHILQPLMNRISASRVQQREPTTVPGKIMGAVKGLPLPGANRSTQYDKQLLQKNLSGLDKALLMDMGFMEADGTPVKMYEAMSEFEKIKNGAPVVNITSRFKASGGYRFGLVSGFATEIHNALQDFDASDFEASASLQTKIIKTMTEQAGQVREDYKNVLSVYAVARSNAALLDLNDATPENKVRLLTRASALMGTVNGDFLGVDAEEERKSIESQLQAATNAATKGMSEDNLSAFTEQLDQLRAQTIKDVNADQQSLEKSMQPQEPEYGEEEKTATAGMPK